MSYVLTDRQKALAEWLVQAVRQGQIGEEFTVVWLEDEGGIFPAVKDQPPITKGDLDGLENAGLILAHANYETKTSHVGRKNPKLKQRERETNRRCALTGTAYEAVDSDFDAPDTSFVRNLTPLADGTNLDPELKKRCLQMLGADSADPTLWDSAVRVALVILEERIRHTASIADPNRTGRDLVNDVFGNKGTLAHLFESDSERVGYRDLYAGVVGVFRNRSPTDWLIPLRKMVALS